MITEQEAREAAGEWRPDAMESVARSATMNSRSTMLVAWAVQELSRREAERAERAKPIDAEWCLANGAAFDLGWMRFYGSECVVSWCESIVWVASKEWKLSMRKIKTRGQLLDLLAALKGGAT